MSVQAVDNKSIDNQKLPLPLKLWGGASLALGIASTPILVLALLVLVALLATYGDVPEVSRMVSRQALAIAGAYILTTFLLTIQSILFGVRLLRNKRHNAAKQCDVAIILAVAVVVLRIMFVGIDTMLLFDLSVAAFYIAMGSYLDPSLRQERQLKRKLRKMDQRDAQEGGTLGLDETGKGFMSLDFFNVFWIFVICCLLGLLMETVYCFILRGVIENRTGLLWGPFSPIYGFGGVLLSLALNRFYDKNPLIIYTVSAFIGGAFEYLVSWFMQFGFGITAWDYSDNFMNIDGRTDLFHIICWGLLGLFWIRLCLPIMIKNVNRIPWNWRYGITAVCAAFMIFDAGMSLLSFDCWYEREAGSAIDTPVAQFFAEHYDNDFMEQHFQTMHMHPERATRS